MSFTQQMGDLHGKTVVVVVGTGIAGLVITLFLKLRGAARVVTVGRRQSRLELAGKLGADAAINTEDENLEGKKWIGTADILVEGSGNEQALSNTIAHLKNWKRPLSK